jgi:serine protease inhibitor
MKIHLLFYTLAVMMLSGCVEDVSPWEKETLAKPTMKEGGTNALAKKFEEHMYYSKEASKGGSGVAGGGCGCN